MTTKRRQQATSTIDINLFVRRVRRHIRQFKVPAVTVVAYECDPFRVLVSCIISLRTKDDVTEAASTRLFAKADSPEQLAKLRRSTIERLIYPASFYKTKAVTLKEISRRLVDEYDGRVPDDLDELLLLKGVGRKTANLVITLGFGKPGICVDTHVHRISNRWGYICTKTPEDSEMALRESLPRRHWIDYNDLLVTFGQNTCVPISPHCSRCPLLELCPQVGVERRR